MKILPILSSFLLSVAAVSAMATSTAFRVFKHSTFPDHQIRYSTNSDLCDPSVKQIHGYLDIPEKDKHFFFWFFESRSKPSTDPLLLWTNGGPGSSSQLGNLYELGGCRVDPSTNQTLLNPHSWVNNASIIFLDQPVNVGFSYSDSTSITNIYDAAEDSYAFISLFMRAFPQYSDLDFHLTGESFAGAYLPPIAKLIVDAQAAKKTPINLKSLVVGNGAFDGSRQQLESLPDYFFSMGFYNASIHSELQKRSANCLSALEACHFDQNNETCASNCIPYFGLLFGNSSADYNRYNVKQPYNMTDPPAALGYYLNSKSVQLSLGVDRPFLLLNESVSDHWNRTELFSTVSTVGYLLDHGLSVLIYAGDLDSVCDWIGQENWLKSMEWSGQEAFRNTATVEWKSVATKTAAGTIKKAGNLTWVRVFEAGHLVPTDQPEHALEMINAWIH